MTKSVSTTRKPSINNSQIKSWKRSLESANKPQRSLGSLQWFLSEKRNTNRFPFFLTLGQPIVIITIFMNKSMLRFTYYFIGFPETILDWYFKTTYILTRFFYYTSFLVYSKWYPDVDYQIIMDSMHAFAHQIDVFRLEDHQYASCFLSSDQFHLFYFYHLLLIYVNDLT